MNVPQEYRRLLVTYPAEWRERYGDAVLSTLLDVHAAQGRRSPSLGEHVVFFVAGLGRRLRRRAHLSLPPLLSPDHRFDQTNGVIAEREPTAFELEHARWWDQEPPPTPIPVGMVGGRLNAVGR